MEAFKIAANCFCQRLCVRCREGQQRRRARSLARPNVTCCVSQQIGHDRQGRCNAVRGNIVQWPNDALRRYEPKVTNDAHNSNTGQTSVANLNWAGGGGP